MFYYLYILYLLIKSQVLIGFDYLFCLCSGILRPLGIEARPLKSVHYYEA